MLYKNSIKKQYIRCIKDCFPIHGKRERQYLKQLEIHVTEFLSFNESATYDTLVSEFGSPPNIVSSYFDEIDTAYLFNNLKKRRYIKAIFIFTIIMITLRTLWGSYLAYLDYLDALEQQIAYEITTIEEIDE